MQNKKSCWAAPLMASLTVLLTDSGRWSTAREAILLGAVEAVLMGCLLVLVWQVAPVLERAAYLRWLLAGYLLLSGSAASAEMWQFYKTVFPKQIGCWVFFALALGTAMLLADSRQAGLDSMAKILAALSLAALLMLVISGWPVFHWEGLSTERLDGSRLMRARLLPEALIFCGLLRPRSAGEVLRFPAAFWGIQAALALIVELALGSNGGQTFPIYSAALLGKLSVFNRLEGIQVLCWLLLLCLKLALTLWAVKALCPKGKPWLSALAMLLVAVGFCQFSPGMTSGLLNAFGWGSTAIILIRGMWGWKKPQGFWQHSCQR